MNAEELAVALGGRRVGRGWIARCPAHSDKHPSLSIAERDGTTLFICRAGCRQGDVLGALRARGLFNSKRLEGVGRRAFSWAQYCREHLRAEFAACCVDAAQKCEHRREFDLEYRLAHLHGELAAAAAEVAALYETARIPLDATALVDELQLAIDVGGIGTCGLQSVVLDRAISTFAKEWCGGNSH